MARCSRCEENYNGFGPDHHCKSPDLVWACKECGKIIDDHVLDLCNVVCWCGLANGVWRVIHRAQQEALNVANVQAKVCEHKDDIPGEEADFV